MFRWVLKIKSVHHQLVCGSILKSSLCG
jgi:hypothetical protein